jgi:hypothetical protein
MANTRGFEVVAQVTVGVLRQIYRDAWKNGGDESGPGTIPQRVSLGPPLGMGPYAVKDGEVVIPEAGLELDMAPDINGVEARLTAQVSVEIDNPPILSASLFNLVADIVIRAPVRVLDPVRNTVGLQLSGLPAIWSRPRSQAAIRSARSPMQRSRNMCMPNTPILPRGSRN